MTKLALDESLFSVSSKLDEGVSDGWDEQLAEDPIIDKLDKFTYEIRSAARGAYTGAHTYSELIDYVRELANELDDFSDTLEQYSAISDEEDE